MGCAPAGGEGGKGSGLMGFLPIVLIFALLYFLMIRPQQKRQKDHQKLVSGLEKGDKVVTAGGIHGVVTGVKEQTVTVKIAENVKIEVSRSSISRVVEKTSES